MIKLNFTRRDDGYKTHLKSAKFYDVSRDLHVAYVCIGLIESKALYWWHSGSRTEVLCWLILRIWTITKLQFQVAMLNSCANALQMQIILIWQSFKIVHSRQTIKLKFHSPWWWVQDSVEIGEIL